MAPKVAKTYTEFAQFVAEWLRNKDSSAPSTSIVPPIVLIGGVEYKLMFSKKGVQYFAVVTPGRISTFDWDAVLFKEDPNFMLLDKRAASGGGALLSELTPYLHHKKDCPYDPALCGTDKSPSDCKLRPILIKSGLVVPVSAKSA